MQTTRGARRVSIAAVGVFCLVFSGPPLAAQAQLALSLNDRGLAAAERSDFAQAERLYGEAIQIWRGLGTAYEAQTAATLVNLGQTLCNEGKAGDGVSVLEQALALDRHSLGSKHLSTLTSLTALGHAYVLSGDSAHAETALSEALAAERELYPGDVLLEHTLLGLSLLRRQERRLDEALQYGEEALNAALKTGGELSPEAGMNYENVARLHRLAGRPDRALPLFRKAVFIYERTLGLKDPSLAMLHSEVGLALLEDGEAALAEREMSQSVDALARAGPAWERGLAIAETNLALLRLRQRKHRDADRLLTHALSVQRQLPSGAADDLAITLRELAQLRKAQRRDAESAELIAEAAGIQEGH